MPPADEADDSDELEGTGDACRASRAAIGAARRGKASVANPEKATPTKEAATEAKTTRRIGKGAEAEASAKGTAEMRRAQSRRTWLRARTARASESASAAKAAGEAARKGAAKTLAGAAASAAGPVAGALSGVLCFVLAVLVVSQLASAIFGFWKNEAAKASLDGLPPYITVEMVEAALECQEKYGHPAGCTLAQIICESGAGDHLSLLAERDKNLFGIKWASSFLGCPEVAGKSSWATNEEYGGQVVGIMADFTVFKGHRECIVFRSRVLLANSRYAGNALIRQAIAEKSSDKMAEGLKDAGYATSSEYVASLKSAMDAYGLRRFDGMSLEDFRSGAARRRRHRRGGHGPARRPLCVGRHDAGRRPRLLGADPVLLRAGGHLHPQELRGPGLRRAARAALRGEARGHPLASGACRHLRGRRRVHPRAPYRGRLQARERHRLLHVRHPIPIDKERECRRRTR